ncbi:MAG: hypothetical protein EBZ49_00230 [Proteobacteria bacterium]|nr:hypothetical protein [Pseudomonadota bacterium]
MIILKNKNKSGPMLIMQINDDASWPEIAVDFVNFLQGCGYIVKGIEVAQHLMEEYQFQKELDFNKKDFIEEKPKNKTR